MPHGGAPGGFVPAEPAEQPAMPERIRRELEWKRAANRTANLGILARNSCGPFHAPR